MKYFKSCMNPPPHHTIYRVKNNHVRYWQEDTSSWGYTFLFGEDDVRSRRDGIEISKLEVLVLCGAEAVNEDRE
jgi:hypothetical protein